MLEELSCKATIFKALGFFCVIWSIGYEHNKIKFEAKILNLYKTVYMIKMSREVFRNDLDSHQDFLCRVGMIFGAS